MNDKNEIKAIYRFAVYLEDKSGGKFSINRRMTAINFRSSPKGLGAASFKLLARNAFAKQYVQVGSIFIRDNAYAEPRPGQRFFIVDTSTLEDIEEEYTNFEAPIVFFGRIRNITLDKYKNGTDYIGEVSGDEEGWHWYQQVMSITDDIPFNANVNGYYIGNKKFEELQFEKYNPIKLKDSDITETLWKTTDQPYVWSLEEAINYIGSQVGVDFTFPWTVDKTRIDQTTEEGDERDNANSSNKAKYKIFLDKQRARSFTSPYGKSLMQWLDENLMDAFTYKFDYTSMGSTNCYIINKSIVDTPYFPKAPSPITVTTNDRCTNVNITEVGETYSRVEVRSNRVLFAGTLTTKNLATNQKTLDRNWNKTDEKNYAYGSTNDIIDTAPGVYRNSEAAQKAYRYFKFVQSAPISAGGCPIICSNPMDVKNEFTERTIRPFFPFVGVRESDGQLTISDSLGSHRTPDTSSLEWTSFLPFGYSDSTEKYKLFEPFVSTTIARLVDKKKSIFHLYGAAEKPNIEFGEDVRILNTNPQVFGYLKNEAELFKINGQSFEPGTTDNYDWSLGAATTNPDPATTSESQYPYFTHWSMIYVTLAGYSSQRITLYRLKDNAAISDRTKIIDADDCNYWIAHPGTFKPVQTLNADATAQGYDYIPEMFDTKKFKIIRNDYQKQKAYLDMWADYLFLDKRSITLDYTLDGWTNTFEIGQPIAIVKDGSVNITTNSIVESIEYFVESGTPRIRISTLLPDLPPLKKLADTVRIEGSAPVISSVATLKTPKIVTKEEEKRINIIKIQGQGGGSGGIAAEPNVWLVQGENNTLVPSSLHGAKWIETIPTTVSNDYNDLVSAELAATDTGVAVTRNLFTGERRLIINSPQAGCPFSEDLINGQTLQLSTTSVNISGSFGSFSFFVPYNKF